jgi:hypothetical protein
LEDLDVDQSIRTLIEAIAGIAVGDRQEAVDVCAEAEVSEVAGVDGSVTIAVVHEAGGPAEYGVVSGTGIDGVGAALGDNHIVFSGADIGVGALCAIGK